MFCIACIATTYFLKKFVLLAIEDWNVRMVYNQFIFVVSAMLKHFIVFLFRNLNFFYLKEREQNIPLPFLKFFFWLLYLGSGFFIRSLYSGS